MELHAWLSDLTAIPYATQYLKEDIRMICT
jgi:hypothetical protein